MRWRSSRGCAERLMAHFNQLEPPEEALRYLRRGEVAADRFAEGMNLVTADGAALGFAKRIGRRCNNLYPNSLRILKG